MCMNMYERMYICMQIKRGYSYSFWVFGRFHSLPLSVQKKPLIWFIDLVSFGFGYSAPNEIVKGYYCFLFCGSLCFLSLSLSYLQLIFVTYFVIKY